MKPLPVRTSLLLSTATVVVAFVLLATAVFSQLLDRFAREQIEAGLRSGQQAYGYYRRSHEQFLREKVLSLGQVPYLRATLSIEGVDQRTVQACVDGLESSLGQGFLLVGSAGGDLLGTARSAPPLVGVPGLPGVREALEGRVTTAVWCLDRRLYWVAAAPVLAAERVIGWVAFGQAVDNRTAAQIGRMTGQDVLVLHECEKCDGQAVSSGQQVTPADLAALHQLPDRPPRAPEAFELRLGGARQLARVVALTEAGGTLMLTRKLREVQVLFQQTFGWLVLAGMSTVVLGFLLSRQLANRLARPIQDLVQASTALAGGELQTQVAESGPTELRQLACSFNLMARQIEQLVLDVRGSAARAEEASRAKDRFLASVSHELRTPITSIRSFTEILLETQGSESAAERAELMTTILSESERLGRLIDDVLDLTRMEGGFVPGDFTRIDARELVQRSITALSGLVHRRNVTFAAHLPDQPVLLYGDPDRLQQVLANLLGNGWKFSAEGHQVEISVQRDGAAVEFRVADRGPGIPGAQEKEAIFRRFYQRGDVLTGKPEGTGLGLAIVREIVRYHAGTITCEDREGGGAVFVVRVPVQPPHGPRPVRLRAPDAVPDRSILLPAR